ncbi:peptide transporter PTR2-A [Dendryphion nanum]|uniref:Peptide transporter PTR2-A n=1 Tax=Dendryphion nanum TaxID=256645 RepID=A0A9P9DXD7_9PLEO|nr:peptide transporter PTR2-A [Dendryphion nanum]
MYVAFLPVSRSIEYLELQSTHLTTATRTASTPTGNDLQTLRRVSAPIPWKVYTIAFVELVERMFYYGTTAVFSNFIRVANPGTPTGAPFHPNDPEAQPGALGLGKLVAQALRTFNQFWIYIMPLFGAWVADTYLGRYKTIVYAVVVAEIGHVILTASAAPGVMDKPDQALGVFVVGLVIMGIGTGAFKPNISPLIAEQIPQERMHVVTRGEERVIIDPAVTTVRIYNWFYLFINIGALVGQLGMVYAERYVGFYLSFLIPTLVFLTTMPVLFLCRKQYTRRAPDGNVLGPAFKLLLFGLKGRVHSNPIATWKHCHDGTFWQSIKPSRLGPNKPAWMNFDDAWVDEVARGWAACSVFLWYPFYWITYNQINNNLTAQAETMTLNGIPNDVLANLNPFAIMILIPLFDLGIYPALRRAGIRFTPIKKIFTGFMIATAAMIWAAVVQYYIYKTSPCGPSPTLWLDTPSHCKSPINVWAQSGPYVLIAASEILASVTSLEYAFTKAPKNMRSLVQAFSLFMSAFSAALGYAFLPLATDPLLVWNYGSAGILAFVAGCLFWVQMRGLDSEEDRLNLLPTGHVGVRAADGEAGLGREGEEMEKKG